MKNSHWIIYLEKIRTGNFYYVDKTYLVEQLVKKGVLLLSRPRRFGKSLLLDTIKQAFLGKKEIFKGLYLEHHWNWDPAVSSDSYCVYLQSSV